MHDSTLTPRREWALLLILATVQFTLVMDFVIMMPLGPQFMRSFNIGPSEFGWMISAYTFAAAVSGLFGAVFIDRFDRKPALLISFLGFAFGTLLCALAGNHYFFVFARIVAGIFSGIMGPVTFAIIGDVIPAFRRGAANGTVMSAFAAASVAGVPIGLWLANRFSWHAPFLFLVGMSLFVTALGTLIIPNLRGHLMSRSPLRARGGREIFRILQPMNHRWCLGLIAALMIAGFSIIPFIAVTVVSNGELAEAELPLVYLCGGGVTLFTSRIFGKLADRFGPKQMFWAICAASIPPILCVAYLVPISKTSILLLMTAFMVFVSGRFVIGTTLIHNGADPSMRGGFLSVMAAVQNAAAGIGAMIAGYLVTKSDSGPLIGMDRVGWLAVSFTFLGAWIASKIQPVSSPALKSS